MSEGVVKTRADFDTELKRVNLCGEWFFDDIISKLSDGPQPAGIPYVWKWPTMHAMLLEACRVIPMSFTARRSLNMMNPGLPKPGTTHTIVSSIQMVLPGEVAWAHRHSFGAIRFAIQGSEQLYTAVSGEKFIMEPGDLVLNPTGTWHDHHNEGEDAGIWLDVLDVPLGFSLNQPFYETYGGSTHPLLPQAPGHPYRFPWNAAREKLYSLAPAELDRFDGAVLQYVDPTTGAAVLPTFGCYLTLLRGGFRGEEQRLSSSAVYHVVQGSGTALIGGQQLEWGPRDTFAIPNWTHHRLLNGSATEDAILFKVSDRPILAALGLVREERPGL